MINTRTILTFISTALFIFCAILLSSFIPSADARVQNITQDFFVNCLNTNFRTDDVVNVYSGATLRYICNVALDNVVFPGTINLIGGKLHIDGGHFYLDNGGSINIRNGGIININDRTSGANPSDGYLMIEPTASVNIGNGGADINYNGAIVVRGALSVNDSGIIDINNGTLSISGLSYVHQGGQINVKRGSQANVNANGTMGVSGQVTNNGKVNIHNSGHLILFTGGNVDVQSTGLLTASPAGSIEIQSGSSLNSVGGSTTNIMSLGLVTMQPGGKFNISPGAVLNVEARGEINNRGILTIEGTVNDKPEGFIDVNENGVLNVNNSGFVNVGGVLMVNNAGVQNVNDGGKLTINSGGVVKVIGVQNINSGGEIRLLGQLNITKGNNVQSGGILNYNKGGSFNVLGDLNVNARGTLNLREQLVILNGNSLDVSTLGIVNINSGGKILTNIGSQMNLNRFARVSINNGSSLDNFGTLQNLGVISVKGGGSLNEGNKGKLFVNTGATIPFSGSVTVQPGGSLINSGAMKKECGGSFTVQANGSFTGNPILDTCTATAGSITHMSDTTASTGIRVSKGGNTIVGERVTSASELKGDKIDQITLNLRKTGAPTGNATIGVFDINGTLKKQFATMNVATLTTSFKNYTFSLTGGQLYEIVPEDRIGIKYDGGDTTANFIQVMRDANPADPFDGTNSHIQRFESGIWIGNNTYDMYMILKQTHN